MNTINRIETLKEKGIMAAIGNTPLVELARIFPESGFRLFAKLEGLNPGGSNKDRAALSIIRHGIESGEINSQTVLVESSSGNMGVGLAQLCAYYGLRFVCVIDPKTTQQNIRLLKVYGAELDLVTAPDPETGEYLQARITRVQELLGSIKNSFWPNQYVNRYNAAGHHRTMQEIMTALDGRVDHLFCATSTCGTLRGCAEYISAHGLKTEITAVDAKGSVIFGGAKAKRLIPGHGAAIRPELYRDGLAERCIHVSDVDCIVGCRRLAQEEAILAGGSSGAVLMAVEYARHYIRPDSNCVLIFPDRGERYLDTIFSDEWVQEHFGEIAHLWRNPALVTSGD